VDRAYGPQTGLHELPANTPAANVIFVAKSTDAGKTFPQVVATFPANSNVLARREGNLVVDPYSGNIYHLVPSAGGERPYPRGVVVPEVNRRRTELVLEQSLSRPGGN